MKKFNYGIEYKMSKACADNLLKTRKGEEQKWDPQKYLCYYVNRVYGVKGTCVRVIIDD